MKRFLILTLCLVLPVSAQLPNPVQLAATVQPPATGGGGNNLVVDLWQDFEGALDAAGLEANDHNASATWTVTGVGKTVDAAAQMDMISTVGGVTDTGVQGLVMDNNTATGVIQCELSTAPTTQTVGFWFRSTAMTDGGSDPIYSAGETSTTDAIIRFRMNRSGSTYTVHLFNGTSTSGTVTISINTAYWATLKVVRNGTCLMQIYDTGGSQVGSEQSLTGQDRQFFYHLFPGAAFSSTGARHVDNFVIDQDGATYPLGP